jgi:hypothetical protein
VEFCGCVCSCECMHLAKPCLRFPTPLPCVGRYISEDFKGVKLHPVDVFTVHPVKGGRCTAQVRIAAQIN